MLRLLAERAAELEAIGCSYQQSLRLRTRACSTGQSSLLFGKAEPKLMEVPSRLDCQDQTAADLCGGGDWVEKRALDELQVSQRC